VRRLASALEASAAETTVETNMKAPAAETKVETHVAKNKPSVRNRSKHESMCSRDQCGDKLRQKGA
jgi:hypothetical protein